MNNNNQNSRVSNPTLDNNTIDETNTFNDIDSTVNIVEKQKIGMDKDEIRLRRQNVKSSGSRPRTLSSMSKKLSEEQCECEEQSFRMTDYLEKRSKMLGWKRYWFVLDGHLLTYYKSKDDYERISPFSGSINLGIASTVRPIQIKGCKGFPLQIVTRSQIYYLRSLEKPILEKWLLALQQTTSNPPKISSPFWTDPGVQFYRYSFAALSQWSLQDSSDDITGSLSNLPKNFYLNHEPSVSLKKKCHSFASLQHPSAFSDSPKPDCKKSNHNYNYNSAGYYAGTTPTKTYKEMTELNTRGHSKVRQAKSMLVLESSPQAMELKHELTKKLSIGTSRGVNLKQDKKILNGNPGIRSLSKTHSKPETTSTSESDENLHHYDEIIDFETMYESCGDNSGINIQDDDNSSGIYESVEADPWEKLKLDQTERHLDRERLSNRNSLLPISEIPENSNHKNTKEKMNLPPIQEDKKLVNFAPSSEGSQDSLVLQEPGKLKKKKKGIAGIFQKIFKKDEQSLKRKKDKEIGKRIPPMVITGPIDLKSHLKNISIQQNYKDEDQKSIQSVTGESLKKHSPPPGSQSVFKSDSVMDELKFKVGQLKRTNSELTPTIATKLLEENSETPTNKNLARRSTIQLTSSIITDNKCNIQENSEIKPKSVLPMTLLFQSSITEYQQKLARFNRLSAHLNPSFVAMFKPNTTSVVLGQMGRSNSCKIKSSDDPPLLPPKRKNIPIGNSNAYDYPSNNSPVIKLRIKSDNPNVSEINGKSPTIRELAKKNSAPEIMFSSSLSCSKEVLPHFLNQQFEMGDTKRSSGTIVPPRPPKKNLCFALPKNSEDFVNISNASTNIPPTQEDMKQEHEPQSPSRIKIPCRNCYTDSHIVESTTQVTIKETQLLEENTESSCLPSDQEFHGKPLKQHSYLEKENEKASELGVKEQLTEKQGHYENISLPMSSVLIEGTIQENQIHTETVQSDLKNNCSDNKQITSNDETDAELPKTETESHVQSDSRDVIEENQISGELQVKTVSVNQLEFTEAQENIDNHDSVENKIDELEMVAVRSGQLEENVVTTLSAESIQTVQESPSHADLHIEQPLEIETQTETTKIVSEQLNYTKEIPISIISKNECAEIVSFLPNISDTAIVTPNPDKFSPTFSNKSMDIDNLDALSELSDDSITPIELQKINLQKDENLLHPLFKDISMTSIHLESNNPQANKSDLNSQAVYENVKYATINTLVTEFEVVEETEDEMSELYDDFPSEFVIPPLPTPTTILMENITLSTNDNDEKIVGKSRVQSIRHSGIDELQKYLNVESHSLTNISQNEQTSDPLNLSKPKIGCTDPHVKIPSGGALSRLGHSPAVDKLQRLLQNN